MIPLDVKTISVTAAKALARAQGDISFVANTKTGEGYSFRKTDGGAAAAGFGKERSTCTVRATALCLGIPFPDAHRKLSLLGRKKGRGFWMHKVAPVYGLTLREELGCHTLAEVTKVLAQEGGRFIVILPRHALAVIEGVVHDSFESKPNKRVKAVYQYC